MHSCILDLGFGFLKNFGVLEIFLWNFWVRLCCFDVICSCIAFSLHYNNVSCILNLWLTIVDCVLVDLDWVFTHDVFKFCTSHVHAFFMHKYLFFSILCFWLWCVLFSLSLSLSLFLSWIDYAMAPKARKSTPARNHFPGSGPSSSDHVPPLNVQFCDEKAQKDFLENFQKSWCSSGALGYPIGLCSHFSPLCHSDLGLGISI